MNMSLGAFLIIIVGSVLYSRKKDKRLLEMHDYDDEQSNFMRKVLIDETQLSKISKPILWVHLPFEKNARNWESFFSRTNNEINQPYIYLTIKSIIEQNATDFHICLIDDNTFGKLIPEWNIDMTRIGEAEKDKPRILGMLKLLFYFGGMFIPCSTLCFKSFKGLYKESADKMFSIETLSKGNLSNKISLLPNHLFFGCKKNDIYLDELIYYWTKSMNSTNFSEDSFTSAFERLCYEMAVETKLNVIEGTNIGTKTTDKKIIMLEDLFSENPDININNDMYCLHIPSDEILKRNAFAWFANESTENIITGRNFISQKFQKVFQLNT